MPLAMRGEPRADLRGERRIERQCLTGEGVRLRGVVLERVPGVRQFLEAPLPGTFWLTSSTSSSSPRGS